MSKTRVPKILPSLGNSVKNWAFSIERSVKIAQSRFVTLIGPVAQRSLVPCWTSRLKRVMGGHAQLDQQLFPDGIRSGLPKFAEEKLQACANDDLWLSPTAEVPITNFYR